MPGSGMYYLAIASYELCFFVISPAQTADQCNPPLFFKSFFFFVISPAYTPGISGPICPSQLKVFLLEYIGKEPLPIFTSFFFFVISPVAQCPSQLIVWFEHCIGIAPLLIFQSSIFYASFFFVISPAQAANHCPLSAVRSQCRVWLAAQATIGIHWNGPHQIPSTNIDMDTNGTKWNIVAECWLKHHYVAMQSYSSTRSQKKAYFAAHNICVV